jgi:pyruvate formate lyase activating enzyme
LKTAPRFFTAEPEGGGAHTGDSPASVKCSLCPKRCSVQSGNFGACGVRGNKGGKGLTPFYGHVTALAMDPIEKKPLYHFRPASSILSLGFSGCNLRCPFCQNWHISQNPDAEGRKMNPEDLIALAIRENPDKKPALAYTYSEPLVHIEFLLDCMALAHEHGIANALVTNGCVNAEAAKEILSLTDAANIDLKCFSAETYSKILGGNLETTLEFIKLAFSMGVHIELTTLVVPGLNDSDEELDAVAEFIAGLGTHIPWHLSAYHPDYRWNAPPTEPALLLRTAERARKIIPFVYTGNIPGEKNDTLCPRCGNLLVSRRGYHVDAAGLAAPLREEKYYRCAKCGGDAGIVCR